MRRLTAALVILALVFGGFVCTEARAASADAGLRVHFIDVGEGDCTLLECGGRFLLIDGGTREQGEAVCRYLESQGVTELTAIICTHGHEDHVGGLSEVLARFPVEAIFAPAGNENAGSYAYFARKAKKEGLYAQAPLPGDVIHLGQADITVLGPVKTYADLNNTSMVLRVDYGDTSFLFAGDMEAQAEADLLDYWREEPEILDTDILKVGHHGSADSSGYRFLYQVTPEFGIISAGAGNDYGHPHGELLERMEYAGVTLLRTDELGTVLAQSDGDIVTLTWTNPSGWAEDAPEPQPERYIGNLRSRILHTPLCQGLPSQRNRAQFDSYQEALEQGYTPCRDCLPPGQ